MEAEFPAESEYNNQNVFLHELCLLEWLKDEYPKSPKTAKIANFQMEKSRKVQGKIFSFFFIEAEFTTQAEHNSQNMPKCLVFLQHEEERDRLKSHSFFPSLDFIDS